MKKTIIYLRQSLDKDKQPQSINMQRDMAMEFARSRDWIIHEVYNDGKCSARKTKIDERPQLKRLLSDVKENKIARIIVFKRDRLARNVQQYIEIFRILKMHGVELHFTADNEPPSFEGIASEFIEAIMAGISEHEANNIVKRLIYSKIPLIRKGYWQVGSIPYAYKPIKQKKEDTEKKPNGRLAIVPERAKIVEALYNEVIHLPKSVLQVKNFNQICKVIKQKGMFSSLTNKQIWDIIAQPLHKGLLIQRLEGEEYRGDEEATRKYKIVDASLWEKANELFKVLDVPSYIKNDGHFDGEEELDEIYPLLEGIVYCGLCRHPLLAKKKVYKCVTKDCRNSPKIITVEEMVFEKLKTYLLDAGNRSWHKVLENLEKKYAVPFKQLADQRKKKVSLLEEKIKTQFQSLLINKEKEYEILLSSLIRDYKTASKENEVLEYLYFHLKHFLSNLNKEKMLESVEEMTFTKIQKQNLFSLIGKVYFYKEPSEMSCYHVTEAENA